MADEVRIYDDGEDDGTPETGSVERIVHEMTVGAVQATRKHEDRRRKNLPREMEQQFQFLVSGLAAPNAPAFTTVTIKFDYAFHYAPAARESNLEYPQFYFGSQSDPPVGLHATVNQWVIDETNGSVIGAVVAIGAVGANTTFTGVVHLTFQGYGVLLEEDETPSITTG